MNPAFDVHTSKTLLEKLRVFEDRKAQFMSLYMPMIQSWGKRFALPDTDVVELTSRILGKTRRGDSPVRLRPGKGQLSRLAQDHHAL